MTKGQKQFAVFFALLVLVEFTEHGGFYAVGIACALAIALLYGVVIQRELEA